MKQRQFSRIDFQSKTFLLHQNQRLTVQFVDISLKGALLLIDQAVELQKGDQVLLQMKLGAYDSLNVTADLVHCQENNFGFKFTSIDLDSLAHLRRLLEINSGDAELIDQELFFLSQ